MIFRICYLTVPRPTLSHSRGDSSLPEVVCKKFVLEISRNSQENNCARSLFYQSCRPQACNFIIEDTLAQVFLCEFCEIYKNTFFIEHLWWLLLYFLFCRKSKGVCCYQKYIIIKISTWGQPFSR